MTQGEEEGEVVPAHDVHGGHLNQCPKWAWKKKNHQIFLHLNSQKTREATFIKDNNFFSCLFKEQRDEKEIKSKMKKSIFLQKKIFFCQITCLVDWQRHPSEEEYDGSDRLEDPVGAEERGHGGVVGTVDNVPFKKIE